MQLVSMQRKLSMLVVDVEMLASGYLTGIVKSSWTELGSGLVFW